MSRLDTIFADLWDGLAPSQPDNFQSFPGTENPNLERQPIEDKGISRVSRVSSCQKVGSQNIEPEIPQAGAGVLAGASARESGISRLETLERLEKSTLAAGYVSSYPSKKLEIKGETGKQDTLRALLTLASDPDRQLAFDERAAFLEYECGLSRAEAEAQATSEILSELPAKPQATVPQPKTLYNVQGSAPAGAGLLLRSWHAGLAALSPSQAPCRDYRGDDWSRVYNDALAFLDTFGAQTEALGWQTSELWGVHPTHGTIRVDHCGALILGSGPVRAITADAVYFATGAYRRKPGHYPGVPIWEVRR